MSAARHPAGSERDARPQERYERAAIDRALARRAEAQLLEAAGRPSPWQREALAAGVARRRFDERFLVQRL